MIQSFSVKMKAALNLRRAVRMVWQAGPGGMVLSALFVFLKGAMPLAHLYLLKGMIDAVTVGIDQADAMYAFGAVGIWVAAAGVAALAQIGLQQVSAYLAERQSIRVEYHIQERLHAKSVAVDLGFYENPSHLDTLHRAQQEGPYRPTRIVTGLFRMGENSVALVMIAGVLFVFKWFAALLLFVAVLPGIAARWFGSQYAFKSNQRQTPAERKSWYYHTMLTSTEHAREIRMLNLGPLLARRYRRLKRRVRQLRLSVFRIRAVCDSVVQGAAAVLVFGMLGYIAFKTVNGAITIGAMVMYFQAFQKGLGCQRTLVEALTNLYEDNLFLSHFYAFLDMPTMVKEPENPVRVSNTSPSEIIFDRVTFRYPGQSRVVLKEVSFKIHPGEVVALVGANGSGKSTLIKLLCRFYDPIDGRITMNGADLRNLDLQGLRRHVGVMFQDAVKYHLSVRDNIGFGNIPPHGAYRASEAALETAARQVGADGFISQLPDEINTVLGNRFSKGTEISMGQWQKLALARTFISPAQVRVLDESASVLDVESEYAIFSRFKQMLAGRSAIIVSHRFSSVRMADRIVVMEEGRITEIGSHEALLEKEGRYGRLYRQQFDPFVASWQN